MCSDTLYKQEDMEPHDHQLDYTQFWAKTTVILVDTTGGVYSSTFQMIVGSLDLVWRTFFVPPVTFPLHNTNWVERLPYKIHFFLTILSYHHDAFLSLYFWYKYMMIYMILSLHIKYGMQHLLLFPGSRPRKKRKGRPHPTPALRCRGGTGMWHDCLKFHGVFF